MFQDVHRSSPRSGLVQQGGAANGSQPFSSGNKSNVIGGWLPSLALIVRHHSRAMEKRLPVLLGCLAAIIPAVWFSVIKVEQIPDFIKMPVQSSAESIGMLLFQSREAALAIEYPLFLVYCAIFGLLIWLLSRFILRRQP